MTGYYSPREAGVKPSGVPLEVALRSFPVWPAVVALVLAASPLVADVFSFRNDLHGTANGCVSDR